MKLFVFALSAFTILTGCQLLKPKNNGNLNTVTVHGTVHVPYCGGAKPSPDVAAGYYESMKHEKFKVLKGTELKEGMEVYQEVSLDVGGNATLQMESGEYIFVQADKFLSLEEFMKMNGPVEEENFAVKESECFENWKNTVDFYLKVEHDTIVEFRKKARCWVGTNPCLEYTGPPAP